jgi:hypothetical protein
MNRTTTSVTLTAFIFFSGLNCHNTTRTTHTAQITAPTWEQINQKIDSGFYHLNEVFALMQPTKKPKQKSFIEVISPGETPNIFLSQDSIKQK